MPVHIQRPQRGRRVDPSAIGLNLLFSAEADHHTETSGSLNTATSITAGATTREGDDTLPPLGRSSMLDSAIEAAGVPLLSLKSLSSSSSGGHPLSSRWMNEGEGEVLWDSRRVSPRELLRVPSPHHTSRAQPTLSTAVDGHSSSMRSPRARGASTPLSLDPRSTTRSPLPVGEEFSSSIVSERRLTELYAEEVKPSSGSSSDSTFIASNAPKSVLIAESSYHQAETTRSDVVGDSNRHVESRESQLRSPVQEELVRPSSNAMEASAPKRLDSRRGKLVSKAILPAKEALQQNDSNNMEATALTCLAPKVCQLVVRAITPAKEEKILNDSHILEANLPNRLVSRDGKLSEVAKEACIQQFIAAEEKPSDSSQWSDYTALPSKPVDDSLDEKGFGAFTDTQMTTKRKLTTEKPKPSSATAVKATPNIVAPQQNHLADELSDTQLVAPELATKTVKPKPVDDKAKKATPNIVAPQKNHLADELSDTQLVVPELTTQSAKRSSSTMWPKERPMGAPRDPKDPAEEERVLSQVVRKSERNLFTENVTLRSTSWSDRAVSNLEGASHIDPSEVMVVPDVTAAKNSYSSDWTEDHSPQVLKYDAEETKSLVDVSKTLAMPIGQEKPERESSNRSSDVYHSAPLDPPLVDREGDGGPDLVVESSLSSFSASLLRIQAQHKVETATAVREEVGKQSTAIALDRETKYSNDSLDTPDPVEPIFSPSQPTRKDSSPAPAIRDTSSPTSVLAVSSTFEANDIAGHSHSPDPCPSDSCRRASVEEVPELVVARQSEELRAAHNSVSKSMPEFYRGSNASLLPGRHAGAGALRDHAQGIPSSGAERHGGIDMQAEQANLVPFQRVQDQAASVLTGPSANGASSLGLGTSHISHSRSHLSLTKTSLLKNHEDLSVRGRRGQRRSSEPPPLTEILRHSILPPSPRPILPVEPGLQVAGVRGASEHPPPSGPVFSESRPATGALATPPDVSAIEPPRDLISRPLGLNPAKFGLHDLDQVHQPPEGNLRIRPLHPVAPLREILGDGGVGLSLAPAETLALEDSGLLCSPPQDSLLLLRQQLEPDALGGVSKAVPLDLLTISSLKSLSFQTQDADMPRVAEGFKKPSVVLDQRTVKKIGTEEPRTPKGKAKEVEVATVVHKKREKSKRKHRSHPPRKQKEASSVFCAESTAKTVRLLSPSTSRRATGEEEEATQTVTKHIEVVECGTEPILVKPTQHTAETQTTVLAAVSGSFRPSVHSNSGVTSDVHTSSFVVDNTAHPVSSITVHVYPQTATSSPAPRKASRTPSPLPCPSSASTSAVLPDTDTTAVAEAGVRGGVQHVSLERGTATGPESDEARRRRRKWERKKRRRQAQDSGEAAVALLLDSQAVPVMNAENSVDVAMARERKTIVGDSHPHLQLRRPMNVTAQHFRTREADGEEVDMNHSGSETSSLKPEAHELLTVMRNPNTPADAASERQTTLETEISHTAGPCDRSISVQSWNFSVSSVSSDSSSVRSSRSSSGVRFPHSALHNAEPTAAVVETETQRQELEAVAARAAQEREERFAERETRRKTAAGALQEALERDRERRSKESSMDKGSASSTMVTHESVMVKPVRGRRRHSEQVIRVKALEVLETKEADEVAWWNTTMDLAESKNNKKTKFNSRGSQETRDECVVSEEEVLIEVSKLPRKRKKKMKNKKISHGRTIGVREAILQSTEGGTNSHDRQTPIPSTKVYGTTAIQHDGEGRQHKSAGISPGRSQPSGSDNTLSSSSERCESVLQAAGMRPLVTSSTQTPDTVSRSTGVDFTLIGSKATSTAKDEKSNHKSVALLKQPSKIKRASSFLPATTIDDTENRRPSEGPAHYHSSKSTSATTTMEDTDFGTLVVERDRHRRHYTHIHRKKPHHSSTTRQENESAEDDCSPPSSRPTSPEIKIKPHKRDKTERQEMSKSKKMYEVDEEEEKESADAEKIANSCEKRKKRTHNKKTSHHAPEHSANNLKKKSKSMSAETSPLGTMVVSRGTLTSPPTSTTPSHSRSPRLHSKPSNPPSPFIHIPISSSRPEETMPMDRAYEEEEHHHKKPKMKSVGTMAAEQPRPRSHHHQEIQTALPTYEEECRSEETSLSPAEEREVNARKLEERRHKSKKSKSCQNTSCTKNTRETGVNTPAHRTTTPGESSAAPSESKSSGSVDQLTTRAKERHEQLKRRSTEAHKKHTESITEQKEHQEKKSQSSHHESTSAAASVVELSDITVKDTRGDSILTQAYHLPAQQRFRSPAPSSSSRGASTEEVRRDIDSPTTSISSRRRKHTPALHAVEVVERSPSVAKKKSRGRLSATYEEKPSLSPKGGHSTSPPPRLSATESSPRTQRRVVEQDSIKEKEAENAVLPPSSTSSMLRHRHRHSSEEEVVSEAVLSSENDVPPETTKTPVLMVLMPTSHRHRQGSPSSAATTPSNNKEQRSHPQQPRRRAVSEDSSTEEEVATDPSLAEESDVTPPSILIASGRTPPITPRRTPMPRSSSEVLPPEPLSKRSCRSVHLTSPQRSPTPLYSVERCRSPIPQQKSRKSLHAVGSVEEVPLESRQASLSDEVTSPNVEAVDEMPKEDTAPSPTVIVKELPKRKLKPSREEAKRTKQSSSSSLQGTVQQHSVATSTESPTQPSTMPVPSSYLRRKHQEAVLMAAAVAASKAEEEERAACRRGEKRRSSKKTEKNDKARRTTSVGMQTSPTYPADSHPYARSPLKVKPSSSTLGSSAQPQRAPAGTQTSEYFNKNPIMFDNIGASTSSLESSTSAYLWTGPGNKPSHSGDVLVTQLGSSSMPSSARSAPRGEVSHPPHAKASAPQPHIHPVVLSKHSVKKRVMRSVQTSPAVSAPQSAPVERRASRRRNASPPPRSSAEEARAVSRELPSGPAAAHTVDPPHTDDDEDVLYGPAYSDSAPQRRLLKSPPTRFTQTSVRPGAHSSKSREQHSKSSSTVALQTPSPLQQYFQHQSTSPMIAAYASFVPASDDSTEECPNSSTGQAVSMHHKTVQHSFNPVDCVPSRQSSQPDSSSTTATAASAVGYFRPRHATKTAAASEVPADHKTASDSVSSVAHRSTTRLPLSADTTESSASVLSNTTTVTITDSSGIRSALGDSSAHSGNHLVLVQRNATGETTSRVIPIPVSHARRPLQDLIKTFVTSETQTTIFLEDLNRPGSALSSSVSTIIPGSARSDISYVYLLPGPGDGCTTPREIAFVEVTEEGGTVARIVPTSSIPMYVKMLKAPALRASHKIAGYCSPPPGLVHTSGTSYSSSAEQGTGRLATHTTEAVSPSSSPSRSHSASSPSAPQGAVLSSSTKAILDTEVPLTTMSGTSPSQPSTSDGINGFSSIPLLASSHSRGDGPLHRIPPRHGSSAEEREALLKCVHPALPEKYRVPSESSTAWKAADPLSAGYAGESLPPRSVPTSVEVEVESVVEISVSRSSRSSNTNEKTKKHKHHAGKKGKRSSKKSSKSKKFHRHRDDPLMDSSSGVPSSCTSVYSRESSRLSSPVSSWNSLASSRSAHSNDEHHRASSMPLMPSRHPSRNTSPARRRSLQGGHTHHPSSPSGRRHSRATSSSSSSFSSSSRESSVAHAVKKALRRHGLTSRGFRLIMRAMRRHQKHRPERRHRAKGKGLDSSAIPLRRHRDKGFYRRPSRHSFTGYEPRGKRKHKAKGAAGNNHSKYQRGACERHTLSKSTAHKLRKTSIGSDPEYQITQPPMRFGPLPTAHHFTKLTKKQRPGVVALRINQNRRPKKLPLPRAARSRGRGYTPAATAPSPYARFSPYYSAVPQRSNIYERKRLPPPPAGYYPQHKDPIKAAAASVNSDRFAHLLNRHGFWGEEQYYLQNSGDEDTSRAPNDSPHHRRPRSFSPSPVPAGLSFPPRAPVPLSTRLSTVVQKSRSRSWSSGAALRGGGAMKKKRKAEAEEKEENIQHILDEHYTVVGEPAAGHSSTDTTTTMDTSSGPSVSTSALPRVLKILRRSIEPIEQ